MKKTLPTIIILILVLAVGILVFSSSGTQDSNVKNSGEIEETSSSNQADTVPDFELENFEGETFTPDDFLGKVTILNSWATWCPFCVNELPDFAKLQDEFQEEINVVAINRQEPKDKADNFIQDLGVREGLLYLFDPRDTFYKSIGGFSMPETLFVNPDGTIERHVRGPLSLEQMRTVVEEMISEG